ncbi:hypothetical protein PQR65_12410 [Paraburkholderia nemoris]|uniref:hypothetical protein n=1 Tax=Paraburkholderia nemoris TaxID=2793076 RepID=UPI0038B847B7
MAFTKTALLIAFVLFMSIPILNLLFGMGFIIWFGVNIFARSAQRGVDFLWLFVGAVICLIGIALPALTDSNHTSYATCWLGGVVLNIFVGVFIAGGRLGHLFQANPEPAQ